MDTDDRPVDDRAPLADILRAAQRGRRGPRGASRDGERVDVERSFLLGCERDRILGRVAGGGTYTVVCACTRSTECCRDGKRDEHDA